MLDTSIESLEARMTGLLRESGRTVMEITRTDLHGNPPSVLYLGASRCPMTAWLWPNGDSTLLIVEAGFVAEPSMIPELAAAQAESD